MTRNNKGFTLVEILIVVIILGILAAIVIPQFTEASNDARESALAGDLHTVRSQLELYKVQHLENYPGMVEDAWDSAEFLKQLTSRTNAEGTVMPDGGSPADYPFGPYLQKFPSNPFVSGDATNQVTNEGDAGDGGTGWYFNETTGKFCANDAAHAGL